MGRLSGEHRASSGMALVTEVNHGAGKRVKVKVDKTLAASVVLHVLVIGWGLVTFSTKALEVTPQESVAVDVISADQLAHVMAGIKTGKKENPKPLVDKVAEAKPVDDSAVGKISDKPPIVTDTAPPPVPKPAEKPVEKKPDPPKPVAETKPKEEPKPRKPVEKKPDPPKVDPIAEAMKKEEKKPPPKPQAQAATPPPPPKPESRAHLRSDQDRRAARQARSDPAGGDRRYAEFQRRARHVQGQSGRQFGDRGARCSRSRSIAAGRAPYGGVESSNPMPRFDIRVGSQWHAYRRAGAGGGAARRRICASTRRAPCARSSTASPTRAAGRGFYDEWKYFAPSCSNHKRTI